MFKLRNLRWLTVLLAIVAIQCLFLAWMTAVTECKGMPAQWPENCGFLKFLYDWQQLIAGFIAILAAMIGWFAIQAQVRQVEAHERELDRRRYAASRAMLPLALSGVSEYTHQCIDALLALYGESETIQKADDFTPPPVPSTSTADLRAMVEACSAAEGATIAKLLARIQVQMAGLRGLQRDLRVSETVVTRKHLEQFFVDTIEIQARASALYRFARSDEDDFPQGNPSRDMMVNAAFLLGLDDSYTAIWERMSHQYKD
jgi:hypothetical protein